MLKNPLIGYSAVQEDDDKFIVITVLDDNTHELLFEMNFDDVSQLAGIAVALRDAHDLLKEIQTLGFDEAIEGAGLAIAPNEVDLEDVDLTVEDIMEAGEGLDDIVDS